MTVILDTGAFIALEKGNRDVAAQLTVALQDRIDETSGASTVTAQFPQTGHGYPLQLSSSSNGARSSASRPGR